MAGVVSKSVKMVFIIILKIILYFIRPECRKVDKTTSRKRLGSPDRQRTSSPVEDHPRRGINFSDEVSSVHSDITNGTDVQDGAWGTFAEYDVPGEERDLDFEEQRIIIERLAGENQRLQMEVMKNNQTTFERMTSDVSFGAPNWPSRDALPRKMTRRSRMFLSVDDVSTVSDTDVRVNEDVSNLSKWRSVDALPHMFTTTTRSMFMSVSDVSAAKDQDQAENENVQQISQIEASGDSTDESADEDIQQTSETQTGVHGGVGSRKQAGSRNVRDMIRIIKRQQYENARLKMYISDFMDTIMSREPSLLEK